MLTLTSGCPHLRQINASIYTQRHNKHDLMFHAQGTPAGLAAKLQGELEQAQAHTARLEQQLLEAQARHAAQLDQVRVPHGAVGPG